MDRNYLQWYSPALQKNMELLVFGHSGTAVLFFPARMARFYDYENWKVIEALRPKIKMGHLRVYCVDSIDPEALYNTNAHPYHKIRRQLDYERYILEEVLPLIRSNDPAAYVIAAGCSLGAYHAVNFALKHPGVFNKVVAMSGRYDLTQCTGHYRDLLDGYWDDQVYFNMPLQYLPNLTNEHILDQLSRVPFVLIAGKADVVLPSNLLLHQYLGSKGISSTLHLWEHEAHQAKWWRKMAAVYL
jgi:esterase/lipase superfamily enzyme